MLCEEHGLFLEIADIIRNFGLTILKGVMEIRDSKIWARFFVEVRIQKRHSSLFILAQWLTYSSSFACRPTEMWPGWIYLCPLFNFYNKTHISFDLMNSSKQKTSIEELAIWLSANINGKLNQHGHWVAATMNKDLLHNDQHLKPENMDGLFVKVLSLAMEVVLQSWRDDGDWPMQWLL